jgi:regulator of RNase E activity RraA
VRDVPALKDLSIPIWSRGTSVVGAGAETRFHARDVGVDVGNGIKVEAGDYLVVDEAEEGVVCVPKDRVDEVLVVVRRLVAQDEMVEREVREGGSVKEAFRKYRGGN